MNFKETKKFCHGYDCKEHNELGNGEEPYGIKKGSAILGWE
jgi:hypothetical protein